MFRIFRRARESSLLERKFTRFVSYAMGEIFLVVVGILIALQINNWNEERIERNEIREYALNLSAAIERDMEMLGPVEMQIRASIRQAEELARYLRDHRVEEIDNAELFFLTTHIGYRPYGWNRAALAQLKASGGLRKMESQLLVQRISDYDALTLHLDQDYREDEESARALKDMINQLVDLNYDRQGLDDVLEWWDGFTPEDIDRRLLEFRETKEFSNLASLGRSPLSENPEDFRRLANLNIEYAEDTNARPNIELPRLRRFAAEIQELIDTEYR